MLRNSLVRYTLMAGLLAFVTTTMLAQTENKTTKETTATKETPKTPVKKFRPRLPNNYGKIGLTNEQRKKVYGIQEKYFYELAKLEEQIESMKSMRDSEIYEVLTPLQKGALEKLQGKPKAGTTTAPDAEEDSEDASDS